ncbi:VCBS repeat-containing protein [Aurantibacter sp.]|uniref:VCBS repeat-containing protein n=1 Tax=Aurantibacter sp. TaxID=2807103 RepID=UPI0032659939
MSMFSEVNPEKSGLQFSNDLSYKENLNIIDYLYYYNGGGVAVGDLNNDGLDDIYFTANQLPDKLYLNKGNLTFEDITKTSGIEIDSTWSTGVSFEDLNNDGFLDIYVSKVGVFREDAHNKVYINQGKLDDNKNVSFIEVSQEIGLNFNGFSTQTAFLDYDNDGDMDIYLLNHAVHTTRSYGGIEKRYEKDSLSGDVFYENKLNEGQFYFEDVTEKVGIYSSSLGYGLGINASDINGDGLTDIYISNDFHENDYLYINNGPKGENKQVTFTESSEKYFTHTSRFSMGMDIGDLNDDNLPDIFTLDMMPYDNEIFLKSGGEDTDKVTQIKNDFGYQTQYARNAMQINTGNGEFSDRALMAKAHATDWSWSALIQDFDNDGLNDVYITNGIYKRPNDLDYINYLSSTDFAKYTNENQKKLEQKLIAQMPTIKLPNVLLKNNGDHSFENISKEIGLTTSYSNGAAYSDFDNDGDIDIIINNINSNATLLENKTQQNQTENYIQFSLDKNNTESVTTGSKVRVFSNGTYREKQLSPSRGFQSASTRTLHFGLGSQKIIDSAQIIWPNGKIQTEKKVVLNTKNSVSQKTDLSTFKTSIISTDISVTEFPYIHFENDYLDYGREPLMPEKLSTEGPALVYEDLTGDGIKDLFIGGSRYHKSSFYKGLASNDFEKIAVSTFEMDEKYEDVNAVAFDLENDGDLDLYVQSGGNDKQEGDPLLEDRMYINQGNGKFERVTAQLPATNGGSLAAGDYNNDGFKDLFVGSRSVPGAYGMSPVSLILKNNTKGGFTAVAQDKMGMVTDSKWADLNNDGFKDLIVIGDWMPITILMNQKNGKFKYATPALGLSKTSGLWNTIEVTDIDGNGSLDILAGNVGENFKWQATTEKPVKLYIDDFDENGQLDPIIFYPLFGNDVPFANRTTLNAQLPYLAKKYKNYNEFSKIKGIEDITDKAVKDINVKKELHELRSMVYLNSGDSLVGHPLPKSAQASTIQDFVVSGKSVAYVGNYKGFVTELGNNDGNAGGILANFDKNTYKKSTNLPLPIGLEAKHIINLSSATYLVISNNNRAYVLK